MLALCWYFYPHSWTLSSGIDLHHWRVFTNTLLLVLVMWLRRWGACGASLTTWVPVPESISHKAHFLSKYLITPQSAEHWKWRALWGLSHHPNVWNLEGKLPRIVGKEKSNVSLWGLWVITWSFLRKGSVWLLVVFYPLFSAPLCLFSVMEWCPRNLFPHDLFSCDFWLPGLQSCKPINFCSL